MNHAQPNSSYRRKEVIGNCTLYLGDCMDVMPTLGKVDTVVTDPPYSFAAKGGGIGAKRRYMKDIEGHLDNGFDLSVFDNHSRFAVFCAKAQMLSILIYIDSRKLSWTLITWNKPNPTPLTNSNYLPDTEYIIHAHDAGGIYGGYKDKARYIVHPVEKNDFAHPTVKPLAVMQKIIRSASNSGQIILDPFMGSASTGVACVKEGRSFIGIEIDEDYFEIACKRIREAYAQPDMFITPPVHAMVQESML